MKKASKSPETPANVHTSVCRSGPLTLLWIIFFLALLWGSAFAQEHTIRVALFVDRGTEASEFRKEFRRSDERDITYRQVDGDDIRNGALKNFDALLIPGGSATTEAISMGPEARDEIRRFIREGGVYMGVCAGAYLASRLKDVYLGLLPLKTFDEEHWLRTEGAPLMDVELTPAGMEVFGIKKQNIRIVYEDGPIFAPPFEKPDDSFTPLGFFRSEVVAPGGQKGVMLGAPAMILSRYGRGVVLVISPHPEETPGLKQVELHALRWLYEHRDIRPSTNQETSQSPSPTAQPAEFHLNGQQDAGSQTDDRSNSSNLNNQALNLARSIFDQACVVRYVHRDAPASRQVIIEPDKTVHARTDCSGFISYIVHSIAPRHYETVRSREPQASYPQAKVWARFFDTLDSEEPHNGWLGVSNWRDLRPGDIIAWKEGKSSSSNTGHVMMAASKPSDVQQQNGCRYFEIPVIDSSSVYHFAPEYLPPKAYQKHRDGLGVGCVRIILSDTNEPIGYWAGTYWGEGQKKIYQPTYSKLVRFARMVPL